MKLRNKRTGEITTNYDLEAIQGIDIDKGIDRIILQTEGGNRYNYYSLAALNDDWEDYEETALDEMIGKLESDFEKYPDEWNNLEDAKEIVKRLKALKRLNDRGFKFTDLSEGRVEFELDKEYSEFTYNGYDEGCEFYVNRDVNEDLETLFGVEI